MGSFEQSGQREICIIIKWMFGKFGGKVSDELKWVSI
jgi:hypothetical protein